MPNRWLDRDEQLKEEILSPIAKAFLEKKYGANSGRAIEFLAQSAADANPGISITTYIADFNAALDMQDENSLIELLKEVPCRALVRTTNVISNLSTAMKSTAIDGRTIDHATMAEYIAQSNTHIAVAVTYPGGETPVEYTASHPEMSASKPQAIHSVGKIFTGALVIKSLKDGIISEEYLDQKIGNNIPPKFPTAEWEKLPSWIKEHLKDCTLRDLMLHTSGLGNYVTNYIEAITKSPPNIKAPIDFFEFADQSETRPRGTEQYSNLGTLLVGMAMQYAYNTKNNTNLSYDEILKQNILNPAGIENFTTHMPVDAITPNDSISQHMVGSPAGGQWSTVADLAKLGNWLVQQSKDPEFMRLLKAHGGEFYDSVTNVIHHNGRTPFSSSEFICDLNNGTVITVLSNMHAQALDFLAVLKLHATNDAAMSLTQSSNEGPKPTTNDAAMSLTQSSNEGLKPRLTSSAAQHPPSVTREFNQESSTQDRKKVKEEQSTNDVSTDNTTGKPSSPKY